jgi:hypothetical protein
MGQRNSDNQEGIAPKLEARYANYFKVGHNAVEFIIDFGQCYPEIEKAELYTRIVTSPVYAKALLEILQDSISRYEKARGKIEK